MERFRGTSLFNCFIKRVGNPSKESKKSNQELKTLFEIFCGVRNGKK